MSDQFQLDNRDLRELRNFYRQAPKQFRSLSANVLNSMAFGTMPKIKDIFSKEMNIRAPGIVKKGIRVQKAKYTDSINSQQSRVGSIHMDRHDAWKAVEEGSEHRATAFTKTGRGGSEDKKSLKAARAGQDHTTPDRYNMNTQGERSIARFLQALSRDRTRRRKPFYLNKGYKRMQRGVYKFVGGRVGTYEMGKKKYRKTIIGAKIRRLSTPQYPIKPDAIHWNSRAAKKAVTTSSLRSWWIKAFEFEIARELKRKFKSVG